MFSDFNKAFKENYLKSHIPNEVLESLNKNLPDGVKYVPREDGICTIEFEESKSNYKFPQINFDRLKESCKNNKIKDPKDLDKYLYNSQKILEFDASDEDTIEYKGKKIKFSDFVIDLYGGSKPDHGTFCIVPPEFPEPFEITLRFKGKSKSLSIKRVPNDSITDAKFVSMSESCLNFSYIYNDQKNILTIKLKIEQGNASSIQDIIDAMEIYNSFCDGELYLGDQKVYDDNRSFTKISENYISCWKKLKELQSLLKVEFNPQIKLSNEDQIIILQLYRTLIQKKPYKEYVKLDQIETTGSNKSGIDMINKNMAFCCIESIEVNILDVKLELYSLVFFYNNIIKDCEQKNNKTIIKFSPMEDKKAYKSVQYFISEKEAHEKQLENKVFEVFHDADEIRLI